MPSDVDRLAQVFIWKQGSAPDVEYARQLLGEVNPELYRALFGTPPTLKLFSMGTEWPADPWARAFDDLRAIPSTSGTRWTDTRHYDLAGWEGTDKRTGERIFMITAYARPGSEAVTPGGAAHAPSAPVAQVPYSHQYPTGPVPWPPQQATGALVTNPLVLVTSPALAASVGLTGAGLGLAPGTPHDLFEVYRPYYTGFGPRLLAFTIDLIFMLLFELVTVAAATINKPISYDESTLLWLVLIFLIVFVMYNVAQWMLWGQTLGKSIMGTKIVDVKGDKPDAARALLRAVGYFFSALPAGLGFALIALDVRRQSLHDKMAETYVVPDSIAMPVPVGMPGYRAAQQQPQQREPSAAPSAPSAPPTPASAPSAPSSPAPAPQGPPLAPAMPGTAGALGLAVVGGAPPYGVGQVAAGAPQRAQAPRAEEAPPFSARVTTQLGAPPTTSLSTGDLSLATSHADVPPQAQRARALFRAGRSNLERGVQHGPGGFKVEPGAARLAAEAFRSALELVPNSALYRYHYGVALRYSEGFEAALREFHRVLELDPGHYEARQQVNYGPYWHDAFAYPAWDTPPPVPLGASLQPAVAALLPAGDAAVTRLVLLRESGNKVCSFLSRTSRRAWKTPPSMNREASIAIMLSRTPYGPILALYVLLQDRLYEPFIGETFLNPHDRLQNSDDACQLGQYMLEQLARQDSAYLIFADEDSNLLMSRRAVLDTAAQLSINRTLYEVQTLPTQTMDAERLRMAAEWHMQHFSLDQVRDQALPLL